MPKNWLKFSYGVWINGVEWQEEGEVYLDPAAIQAVESISNKFPSAYGSIIYTANGKHYAVKDSTKSVIAEIQSALAN